MYKILLVTLSVFIISDSVAQQFLMPKAGVDVGTGAMAGKFKNAYGIGLTYMKASEKCPLSFAVSGDMGMNGWRRLPYSLQLGNSITNTNVMYMSTVVKATVGGIYEPKTGKVITPFIGLHTGGVLYNTEMQIEDPEDPHGCRALERRQVSAAWSFVGKAETGVRMRFKSFNLTPAFLQLSVAYTHGARAEYVNLSNDAPKSTDEQYNVKFQNQETGEIHEHSIGQVYKSPTQLLSVYLGVAFKL